MRLICPNCDAQYEVDAAMIPAAGRDVQCSNCGKTWFQAPEGAVAAPKSKPEPAPAAPDRASGLTDEARAFFEGREEEIAPAEEPGPAPEPEPEPESVSAGDASGYADEGDTDFGDEDDDEDTAPPDLPRREIDPAVLGILKAEAERELAARKAEAEAMETQPDLGLSEPAAVPLARRQDVEARTARLRGADDTEEAASARKSVLPDIDEINSTLTATSDRKTPRAAPQADVTEVMKRRTGFRFGFSFVMLLTALLILTYLYAPQIADAVPALEPALAAYVDWANAMRLSIDGFLERSVESLTALLISLSN